MPTGLWLPTDILDQASQDDFSGQLQDALDGLDYQHMLPNALSGLQQTYQAGQAKVQEAIQSIPMPGAFKPLPAVSPSYAPPGPSVLGITQSTRDGSCLMR